MTKSSTKDKTINPITIQLETKTLETQQGNIMKSNPMVEKYNQILKELPKNNPDKEFIALEIFKRTCDQEDMKKFDEKESRELEENKKYAEKEQKIQISGMVFLALAKICEHLSGMPAQYFFKDKKYFLLSRGPDSQGAIIGDIICIGIKNKKTIVREEDSWNYKEQDIICFRPEGKFRIDEYTIQGSCGLDNIVQLMGRGYVAPKNAPQEQFPIDGENNEGDE
jgi:hypothetical protein